VSQFEDLPVIADGVFEYTDTLHAESVPIVIDNGSNTHYLLIVLLFIVVKF